jgi:predicted phosphodiesterase
MRVGVLTDLHFELDPSRRGSWINDYEPELLDERVQSAIAHFDAAEVDVVVLLGDVTERGDDAALERAFSQVARETAPVATVVGNHDVGDDPALFAGSAARASVRMLEAETFEHDGVEIAGIGIARENPGTRRFRAAARPGSSDSQLRVLASHFPVLSEALRLASAGLPYPGDLTDRGELAETLANGQGPLVVLSGHIHARCSRAEGPVLQLSFGAMIEPPFDCAVVEISSDGVPRVERRSHRLGPVPEIEPVFAADHELWEWRESSWREVQR